MVTPPPAFERTEVVIVGGLPTETMTERPGLFALGWPGLPAVVPGEAVCVTRVDCFEAAGWVVDGLGEPGALDGLEAVEMLVWVAAAPPLAEGGLSVTTLGRVEALDGATDELETEIESLKGLILFQLPLWSVQL